MMITIGIPTYGGADRLENLLLSILSCKSRELVRSRILIIDDGTPDEESKANISGVFSRYRELFSNIDLLVSSTNDGVANSWNKLVNHYDHDDNDIMVLLNDDIEVVDDWLDAMVFFLTTNKDIGTVSLPIIHLIRDSSGNEETITPLPVSGIRTGNTTNVEIASKPLCVSHPHGCCFAFKIDVFRSVNGFDNNYFAFYEEIDFGIEALKLRLPSYILPHPWVYHLWGATFAANPDIDSDKLKGDSRQYFIKKHSGDTAVVCGRYLNRVKTGPVKWFMGGYPESIT